MVATRVLGYSHDTLCELLAEVPGNSIELIRAKRHAEYFREYFGTLRAETIVVEDPYIDHDFLDDFAAYYVRCFKHYSRYCKRLHFFSAAFDEDAFARVFDGDELIRETLQASYRGFMVLRPIPEKVIGRTCLATYSPRDERHFATVHVCKASLFGLELTVQSIPFQEQDRAVAACATSALWSVFQGTGHAFHHRIPSPAEITRRATATNPLDVRAFPAGDGLMFVQMADAVRACELEPLWLTDTSPIVFRAAIYAYLNAEIPLLLNGEFLAPAVEQEPGAEQEPGVEEEPESVDEASSAPTDGWERVGVHAVAVVGYRLEGPRAELDDTGPLLRSSRMSKLYCHDDGVGPFARMEFRSVPDGAHTVLTTSQARSNAEIGAWLFQPDAALVALYHKIRVPFIRIFAEVQAFDNFLRQLADQLERSDVPDATTVNELRTLEWDIRLTTLNRYKAEVLDSSHVVDRRSILESSLPRYLWLAHGRHEDDRGIALLFDATGLELSNLCLRVVEHGSTIPTLLRELHKSSPLAYEGCEGILETLFASGQG